MNKYYYEVLIPDVTSPTIIGRLNVNTQGAIKLHKLDENAIEKIKKMCVDQTEKQFPHCQHPGPQLKIIIKLDE